MWLTETSGRLTRWRLKLAEFDFTIQHRPGGVHQGPNALSLLIESRAAIELQRSVDNDIPGIDSDDGVKTTSKGGYGDGWSHRILYIQKQPV